MFPPSGAYPPCNLFPRVCGLIEELLGQDWYCNLFPHLSPGSFEA
jgi:hypothetical protein